MIHFTAIHNFLFSKVLIPTCDLLNPPGPVNFADSASLLFLGERAPTYASHIQPHPDRQGVNQCVDFIWSR